MPLWSNEFIPRPGPLFNKRLLLLVIVQMVATLHGLGRKEQKNERAPKTTFVKILDIEEIRSEGTRKSCSGKKGQSHDLIQKSIWKARSWTNFDLIQNSIPISLNKAKTCFTPNDPTVTIYFEIFFGQHIWYMEIETYIIHTSMYHTRRWRKFQR